MNATPPSRLQRASATSLAADEAQALERTLVCSLHPQPSPQTFTRPFASSLRGGDMQSVTLFRSRALSHPRALSCLLFPALFLSGFGVSMRGRGGGQAAHWPSPLYGCRCSSTFLGMALHRRQGESAWRYSQNQQQGRLAPRRCRRRRMVRSNILALATASVAVAKDATPATASAPTSAPTSAGCLHAVVARRYR